VQGLSQFTKDADVFPLVREAERNTIVVRKVAEFEKDQLAFLSGMLRNHSIPHQNAHLLAVGILSTHYPAVKNLPHHQSLIQSRQH
jgi:hypothetical protein